MATKKKFIGEAAATEILKKIADNHELNLSTRDMAHEARQGAEAALGLIDDLNTTKGKANGLATLDSAGKVPEAQVPPCILEFDTKAAFPATGKVNKIYVSKNDNKMWRWNGTAYVEISASIALGETSSTAYAGNKGKANADAIASLNTWKSTASSDISTLKTWKTSASSDISTAKTDISSLKTKVSALEGVTYVEMTAAEIDAIYNELATA